MNTIYQEIGLKDNNLYEVLASTFSYLNDVIVPNTACMGIRIINDNIIVFNPYTKTHTHQNVKKHRYVIFNLVDDIYSYALASLKKNNTEFKGIEDDQYNYYNLIEKNKIEKNKSSIALPFLKDAWAIIVTKVIEEIPHNKHDDLGESSSTSFKLKILDLQKYSSSYKLINRAENLALEILILATRLKLALEIKNKEIVSKIEEKINRYLKDINRFSKNERVSMTIDYVKNFLQNIMN